MEGEKRRKVEGEGEGRKEGMRGGRHEGKMGGGERGGGRELKNLFRASIYFLNIKISEHQENTKSKASSPLRVSVLSAHCWIFHHSGSPGHLAHGFRVGGGCADGSSSEQRRKSRGPGGGNVMEASILSESESKGTWKELECTVIFKGQGGSTS